MTPKQKLEQRAMIESLLEHNSRAAATFHRIYPTTSRKSLLQKGIGTSRNAVFGAVSGDWLGASPLLQWTSAGSVTAAVY